jgi:YHS domain-containing protein
MKRFSLLLMLAGLIGALVLGSTVVQASEERLALKGYDTVAYFTEKRPMMGDPKYQHEFDGALYRFASAKHLEMFKADPDRYLPQHRNLCTASLSRGEQVLPDPNHWIIHEGRLYLFGGPKGPSLLLTDADGMKARANANFQKFWKSPAGSQR